LNQQFGVHKHFIEDGMIHFYIRNILTATISIILWDKM